jgi:hypothetical protein
LAFIHKLTQQNKLIFTLEIGFADINKIEHSIGLIKYMTSSFIEFIKFISLDYLLIKRHICKEIVYFDRGNYMLDFLQGIIFSINKSVN